MLNVQSTTVLMVIVNAKQNFVNIFVKKLHKYVLKGVLMYLNWTNMYPLGFNGLIECRLLNIFEWCLFSLHDV